MASKVSFLEPVNTEKILKMANMDGDIGAPKCGRKVEYNQDSMDAYEE